MSGKVLSGCNVLFLGFYKPIGDLKSGVKNLGGSVASLLRPSVTHVVTTENEMSSTTIEKAISYKTYIITKEWVEECIAKGIRVNESSYFIGTNQPSSTDIDEKEKQEKEKPKAKTTYDFGFTASPLLLQPSLLETETSSAKPISFSIEDSSTPESTTSSMFEQFPSSSFQRESFFSKPTDNNATFESQLITPSSSDIDEGINNEEKYRRLFASDKHNSSLRDPHLNLINIMDNVSTFKYQSLTNEEDSIPSLLSKHKTQKVTGSSCVCTSIDKFKDNWNAFTENQFNGLNWNNLFVAGGAVLACLQPDFSTSLEVGNPFHSADIDIFIYGLSQSDATKKLKHVYEIVKKNTKCSTVIRSQYAITIIGQYPYRHTQIILRIYQSPAEVLMGFDIDCCGVGFDGKNVYALPRARRALTKQYNLVDLSRRSLTYEMRLHKYSTRGYEVKVPGMDASKISNNLYFNTIGNVNGLAKLLIFDNNQTKHYKVRKIKQPKGAPPPLKKRKDQESDYSNVSLPWGPNWILPTIINAINSQNQKSASSSNNNNDSKPEHIFITDIQGALSGRNRSNCICSVCKQGNSPPTTSDPVCGPLRWVTENPGRQILTGSFHPVNDNEWWNDAYRSWEQPENATLQINLPFKLPPRTKLVGVKPPKKKAVLKSIPAKSKPSIPAQPFTFQQNTTPPVKPQQGGTTLVFGRTPGLQEFMSQHSTPPSWGSTFTETVQPESDTAKLLLLVSKLCRDNLLTSDEKSQIKNLILRRNAAIISALEVFEIEKDFHELADSLKRICRRE